MMTIRQHHMNPLRSIRLAVAGVLLGGASLSWAQNWVVQTISTRVQPNGQPVSLAFAVPEVATTEVHHPAVRHVLVYQQSTGAPQLKVSRGTTSANLVAIWANSLPHLQRHGVTLVHVDVPSDAEGRALAARPRSEVRQDLSAVAKEVKKLYPEAQLHLASFSSGGQLLDVADDLQEFKTLVLVSSAMGNFRMRNWINVRQPVLMFQAPGAQCDGAPFLEAQDLASRHRFTLVKAGYAQQEGKADCGRTSQHALHGLEAPFAQVVFDWLDGKGAPPFIGSGQAQIAWREEIISYQVPSTFGSTKLEATLLLPEERSFGPGPYPVMVWNHGDIELDHPAIRDKSRIREMVVPREFLRLGVAVLMPARRGVGLSEGTYPKGFSTRDGDPTYKARMHAEDILPALVWIKTRSELDASRTLVAGQSAGGYGTMYIASQNPPGVIGAINFSGGRTDKIGADTAGYLNKMMVDGFAEFGRSTRIPELWVFAENDSRYSATTIRASHEAFQATGGKARLLINPPTQRDGHFVYNMPEIWRASLREYLKEIGVIRVE